MNRLKRLLQEVHQRSVWQALAVYFGASYAVLEAAAYFRDEFGLPDWLPPVALVLLLIGMPVVVVTSLAREEVFGGEVPAGDAEAAAEEDRRLRLLTWRTAGLSFVGAMAIWGVIAAGLLLTGTYGRVAADERRSIAVLPFENLSPDPDDAYFAEGIHEEIISQLGKIASLKVISRTSVMEYRDRDENLRTIAEELGVTHVLEGSVRRSGDRVRITTQLIAAQEDEHLWAENYERELRDVFAIQADVAEQVATSLRATLTPQEIQRIRARRTENPEAYEYYLKAETTDRGVVDGQELAIVLYDSAVSLDPNFAAAWAALGRAKAIYLQGGGFGYATLEEVKQAVDRALALDPDLPETQLAAGFYYYAGLRDWDSALTHFRRAQRLEPSNAEAAAAIGYTRRRQGRWQEAVAQLSVATELDPRAVDPATILADALMAMREYERALQYLDRVLALDSADVQANVLMVQVPIKRTADIEGSRKELERATARAGRARVLYVFSQVAAYAPYRRILVEDFERLLQDSLAGEYVRANCPVCYWGPRAEVARARGELAVARAYDDSVLARVETTLAQIEDRPAFESNAWRGIGRVSADLGDSDRAIEAAERAVRLLPVSKDAYQGTSNLQSLAEVYTLTGEQEKAIETLDTLLSLPSYLSVHLVRLDPIYEPLRHNPRFQALLEKYE